MVLGSGHPFASYIGAQPTANLHIGRHDFPQGVLLNGLLFSLGGTSFQQSLSSKNSGYSPALRLEICMLRGDEGWQS